LTRNAGGLHAGQRGIEIHLLGVNVVVAASEYDALGQDVLFITASSLQISFTILYYFNNTLAGQ
jgi:hypothetical protein